jgi:hypothetical protein
MKYCMKEGGKPCSSVSKWNVDFERFSAGISLFNRGAFFEAHEVLEDVWRPSIEPERKFLQGLIQVAVALHHHSKGNSAGATSLLQRAARNLQGYPDDFCGVALGSLRESVAEWRRALEGKTPVPQVPKIVVSRPSSVVRKSLADDGRLKTDD